MVIAFTWTMWAGLVSGGKDKGLQKIVEKIRKSLVEMSNVET